MKIEGVSRWRWGSKSKKNVSWLMVNESSKEGVFPVHRIISQGSINFFEIVSIKRFSIKCWE